MPFATTVWSVSRHTAGTACSCCKRLNTRLNWHALPWNGADVRSRACRDRSNRYVRHGLNWNSIAPMWRWMEPSGCTHSIYHNSSFQNHFPTERWCADLRVQRNATLFVHGDSRTDIELLGATDSPSTRRRSEEFLDAQIAEGNAWVAVVENTPVSLSAFNAALPDIVQLGGIYTPPALRGRGFAKVAVAASLLVARDRGSSRAVLFTNNPSAARAYEAIGFRRIGDYSLVLLR